MPTHTRPVICPSPGNKGEDWMGTLSGDHGKELQRFLGGGNLADLAKGINSQPKDLGLEADPAYEQELRKQNPKDEEYRAKLWEYRNRLTEAYQAQINEYYFKLVAHIILASIVGRSTREIQRKLKDNGIMWSYNNVDEMIFRWKAAALAQGWPDDLRERLSGIAAAGPGSSAIAGMTWNALCWMVGRKLFLLISWLKPPSFMAVLTRRLTRCFTEASTANGFLFPPPPPPMRPES